MKQKINWKQAVEIAKKSSEVVLEQTKKGAEIAFDKSKEVSAVAMKQTIKGAGIVLDKSKEVSAVAIDRSKEGLNSAIEATKDGVEGVVNKAKENIEQGVIRSKSATESESLEDKVDLDEQLKVEVDRYNECYASLNELGMALHIQRERSVDLIDNITNLINSIANHPKSFDTDIAEIEVEKREFIDVCTFAKMELSNAKKSAAGMGVGSTMGVGVAALAPTAAMWVATTFGAASTGTAISTLSGAAATNAALAWLGGGALTAGGGGMVAGNALLALAGPIGWSIAGASVLTSVALLTHGKMKLNKKKMEEIESIQSNYYALLKVKSKIESLLKHTFELREALLQQYQDNLNCFNADYIALTHDNKIALGVLVNNTKTIAISLSENVTAE